MPCLILALVLQSGRAARAVKPSPVSSPESAAEESTHPFFDTNTVQVQPAYTDIREGGNSTQLLVRLAVVYQYFVIPGLKLGDTYTFARVEMYGEALNTPTSPNVVGLQDWNALLLGVKPFDWGAQLALGVYAVLPTATNPALDTQEFQIGPALGAMVTHVRHLQIGALVEFFFSAAGASPGLATAQLQPIIVWNLPKAFFFKTDGIMSFDFHQSPHATVPVNLHLGHGFTSHLVVSAIVEGVTTGSGVGNVTVKLNLNYLGW
jgi:hypothetical protein